MYMVTIYNHTMSCTCTYRYGEKVTDLIISNLCRIKKIYPTIELYFNNDTSITLIILNPNLLYIVIHLLN